MRRISVVGNSGSGKTTVAKALAARLSVPHVELDAIYHQANWTPLPTDQFRRHVADAITSDGWVVDGNYSSVRDVIWERADTVVWLDLPRRVVMRRVAARTLHRMVRGEELWNTNRERWRNLLDADKSIIVWAWTQHDKYRQRYSAASQAPNTSTWFSCGWAPRPTSTDFCALSDKPRRVQARLSEICRIGGQSAATRQQSIGSAAWWRYPRGR